MNSTDVEAPNPRCRPKLNTNCELEIWLVDWNVVPGLTKMLIQEHVVLGEITCMTLLYC